MREDVYGDSRIDQAVQIIPLMLSIAAHVVKFQLPNKVPVFLLNMRKILDGQLSSDNGLRLIFLD